MPSQKENFSKVRKECFAFYVRELLGSRTVIPPHIPEGLKDLFENFTSKDDLRKEIAPSMEKSLLRSPEVALCDIISPVISALPEDMDLTDILSDTLLKGLLANVKSSKSDIREGVVRVFAKIAT